MLSPKDLDTVEHFFGQSSQGPWDYAQFSSTTIGEHIALMTDMLTKSAGKALYGVTIPQEGKASEDEPRIVALTGNGPTSAENAQFITMAHEIMPRLVDELRQSRHLLPVLQQVYRKHVLGDDGIGWQEVSDALHTALTEAMGDHGFQAWLEKEPT